MPDKKTARPAHPAGDSPADGALGLGDEVGWSRLAQPDQHGWTDAEAKHKVQELPPLTDAPAPKALACYTPAAAGAAAGGADVAPVGHGAPGSAVTIEWLTWISAQRAAQGFTALLLSWDNASWHRSYAVRHRLRQHQQQVKQGAGRARRGLPMAEQKSMAQPH